MKIQHIRSKAVPITIRVTPEEKAVLQHLAKQAGLSYSRLIMGLVQHADTRHLPTQALKPSELRKLPLAEREAILLEQTERAAALYKTYPDMIVDGSDEIIAY